MAKRFTDNNKWDDPWFCDLSFKAKLIWLYLLDKCNHAGIYNVNLKLLRFHLELETIEADEILKTFGDRIETIDDDKWFIPKFIDFQYGELSDTCKPHVPVLKELKKYKLVLSNSKGYPKGIHTLKEKEQEQEKEKEKKRGCGGKTKFIPPTHEQVASYCKEKGYILDIERFIDFYESKGWLVGKSKMKNWQAAVRNARDWCIPKANNSEKQSEAQKQKAVEYKAVITSKGDPCPADIRQKMDEMKAKVRKKTMVFEKSRSVI